MCRSTVRFILENSCLGCGWCENKCPVEGAASIRINIIGEVRLISGPYQEKAREYGYLFKAKGHGLDRLAPGTFDSMESDGSLMNQLYQEGGPKRGKPPPGFSDK